MNIINLPEKYISNMKELLKEDYEKYLESLSDEIVKGVRLNTLKVNENSFFNLIGKNFEKVPYTDIGYYITEDDKLTKNPYYNAGLYYIQEPSAMLPATLLEINSNDIVLDMCASPGGKATHLGAKLNNTGLLVANDISPSRARALVKNIELMGITNAIITAESNKKLEEKFENFFDKILVDAPCSGEGMFRRDKNTLKEWDENSNIKYSKMQIDILESAHKMLVNGGQIVYSTCTFSKIENEDVIQQFIDKHNEYEIIKTIRIFPHTSKGEGHFATVLTKAKNKNNISKKTFESIKNIVNEKELNIFNKFTKENLNIELNGFLVKHENSLFITNVPVDLNGIRVMRSGFYLGDFKSNNFIPSQALALSLKDSDFKNVINLDYNDSRVIKYLKGETIEYNIKNGYVLICVNSYPLGFGMCLNNKIKNKLAKNYIIN